MRADGRIRYAKVYQTIPSFSYYDPSLKWVGGEKYESMMDFGRDSPYGTTDCFALESWPVEKVRPWYGDNFVE